MNLNISLNYDLKNSTSQLKKNVLPKFQDGVVRLS